MSFTEMRQYKVRDGRMDEWVKFFDEEIVPYQLSKGVVIHNWFRGDTNDSNVFFWIRSFESEEQRVAQYIALYQCAEWENYYGPKVNELLDKGDNDSNIICNRIVLAGKSPALPLAK